MSAELEAVMEKIAKLQSMADSKSGASENEVAICNEHIKKLLAKHNLSMAQILQKKGAAMTFEKVRADEVNQYSKWEQFVHRAVAEICSCRVFYSHGHGWVQAVFVGTQADAAIALKMYHHLRKTIISMSRRAKKAHELARFEFSGNCYRLGVANRLLQRAAEAAKMDTPEEQAQYGALVIVKDKQLKEHMETLNLKSSWVKAPRIQDSESFQRGMRDGAKVDIGRSERIE